MSEFPIFAIKFIESTITGTNPEESEAVFINCRDKIVTQAVGIIGICLVMYKIFLAVEFIQASPVGSDPEYAGPVLINRLYIIAAQAAGIIGNLHITGKGSGSFIKPVEPAVGCTDPEYTGPVLIDGVDIVTAQAAGFTRLTPVMKKFPGFPVQYIETTSKSSDPEHPGSVLANVSYNTGAQAPRIRRLTPTTAKVDKSPCTAVKSFKTVVKSSNPEYTLPVLDNSTDIVTAQAVGIPGDIPVMDKHLLISIADQPTEPTSDCAYPEVAAAVRAKGIYKCAVEGAGVIGKAIYRVTAKCFSFGIKSIQSPAPCSNPDFSRTVFANVIHLVVTKAAAITRFRFVYGKFAAVIFI
jgi:hypothetical protein